MADNTEMNCGPVLGRFASFSGRLRAALCRPDKTRFYRGDPGRLGCQSFAVILVVFPFCRSGRQGSSEHI